MPTCQQAGKKLSWRGRCPELWT